MQRTISIREVVYRGAVKMRIFAFLLAGAMLGGCAGDEVAQDVRYYVHVNSFGANTSSGKSFYVVSGRADVPSNDPEFAEYTAYLAKALTRQGFLEVPDQEKADLVISLVWGISDPETTLDHVSMRGGIMKYSKKYAAVHGEETYHYSSTYNRTAQITAYDGSGIKSTGSWTVVWKTNLSSNGQISDLRRVFPILLVGGLDYLGEDSGGEQIREVHESDELVTWIKTAFAPPAP
jgi:hypothetical protein